MRRETLILLRPVLLALAVPLAATSAIAVLSAARPANAPPGPTVPRDERRDLGVPGVAAGAPAATVDLGRASAACSATGATPPSRAHPRAPGRFPSGPETSPPCPPSLSP